MIETAGKPQAPVQPAIHRAVSVIVKDRGGQFARPWRDLDPVSAGEALAIYDNGEKLLSPVTGSVLLPHDRAAVGTEWLYLAVPA